MEKIVSYLLRLTSYFSMGDCETEKLVAFHIENTFFEF